MSSTLSSAPADPTMATDRFTGVEEALTRLAHQAASDTPDARPREPASDRSAEAPTLGPADLRAPIQGEQRPLGKRGIVRVAIAVCLGACAIWAWRSYGDTARDLIGFPPFGWISPQPSAAQTPASEQAAAAPAIETSAPPPAQTAAQAASIAQPVTTAADEPATASAMREQNDAMARDLAALRQTVEQLAAGQEQLTREIAKLQAEKPQADSPKPEKPMPRRVSTPVSRSDLLDAAQKPNAPGVPRTRGSIVSAPPVAAPAHRPGPVTPVSPQGAPQVSTVSPLPPSPQPAPQIPSEPQSSDPPPLRPPMPVPQP
jgi:hypothetical protein